VRATAAAAAMVNAVIVSGGGAVAGGYPAADGGGRPRFCRFSCGGRAARVAVAAGRTVAI
jgi:hypothetical protein